MGLQDAKLILMGWSGLDKDALHVYVGLFAFFGSSLLFRWPVGDTRPLWLVAAVAVGGEIWDVIDNARLSLPMQWQGHWHDVWNTLFWPTAIVLLARVTPLFRR